MKIEYDKLRLGICFSISDWVNSLYNESEMYEKFDTVLKEIDEEYRTRLINLAKYKLFYQTYIEKSYIIWYTIMYINVYS